MTSAFFLEKEITVSTAQTIIDPALDFTFQPGLIHV